MYENTNILFLHSLFTALQKAGFELGFDDYKLLFKALKGGFGLKNENDLQFLCKKIWLKNIENEDIFNHIFGEEFNKEKENATVFFESLKKKEQEKQIESSNNQDPDESKSISAKEVDTDSRQIDESEDYDNKKNDDTINTNEITNDEILEERLDTLKPDTIKLSIENIDKNRLAELDHKKEIIPKNQFIYSGNFYSLKTNKILNIIKSLKHDEYDKVSSEINIEASIDKYIEQGLLVEPVYFSSKSSNSELIILVDHSRSMVAFIDLIEYITRVMTKSDFLNIQKFYFYEIPKQLLFLNISHTKAEETEIVLQKLMNKNTSLLIFSDADSAYGMVDSDKIYEYQQFIERIKRKTKQIAWINPMPRKRWINTNATYIKRSIPMFTCTEQGLNSAIKVLKGKLFFEKIINTNNL